MIITRDVSVWMLYNGTFQHQCPNAVISTIDKEWKYCPFCGQEIGIGIEAIIAMDNVIPNDDYIAWVDPERKEDNHKCPECGGVTSDHTTAAQLPLREFYVVTITITACTSCKWMKINSFERSDNITITWF